MGRLGPGLDCDGWAFGEGVRLPDGADMSNRSAGLAAGSGASLGSNGESLVKNSSLFSHAAGGRTRRPSLSREAIGQGGGVRLGVLPPVATGRHGTR